jgi:hypothetical protein
MMARAQAAPLRIVKVQAPDVHCKFAADCSPTVKDFSDTFTLSAARGEGTLQSRTLPVGEPRTAGAGLYCYE